MPFCTQCGADAQPTDQYCAKCGARQAGAIPLSDPPQAAAPGTDPLSTMSPRTAKVICYIPFVGWLAAIVVLASNRFRHERQVRFHAFQGLYLFVVWLMVDWVFSHMSAGPFQHMPFIPLLKLAVIGVWIFMMVKANKDESVSLPVLGDLAERSMAEW